MIPTTQPTPVNRMFPPTMGRVAICHPHPERFVSSTQCLPAAAGSRMLFACEADEGIEAALHGRVDTLVVDAGRIGVQGLTALSFLRREHPEVAIYFAVEIPDFPPQLVPWERFS
jgi:DNA-binding NarL/FixJ family response regulator